MITWGRNLNFERKKVNNDKTMRAVGRSAGRCRDTFSEWNRQSDRAGVNHFELYDLQAVNGTHTTRGENPTGYRRGAYISCFSYKC